MKTIVPDYRLDMVGEPCPYPAVATLEAYEPVSETPTFTFKARLAGDDTALAVNGRDTEGNRYAMSIPVPAPVGN